MPCLLYTSFIGLVWATVGMTFYTSPDALAAAGGPAHVVTETARALMGLSLIHI